ncbi:MAG: VIT domain-containing protein [Deltaproteobacteria bacterium]|nr:VIT domain-containing protein [Deltaproteobacteria bacterium]
MMPQTALSRPTPDDRSSGGRLVAADGRTLPLREARLEVEAEGGLARVILEQTFENPHDEPLAVTYQLPLPERGAVSGFSFTLGALEVIGEVDRRESARERFEEALALGRTAALLEQDRSSLFTQEVGNLPPRETVVARIVIDQRLDWLAEGAWSWRFPTVVAPRYLGAAGRVPDAAAVEVDVSPAGTTPRAGFVLRIADRLAGGEPGSPSHHLHVRSEGAARIVGLASETGAALDRDLVVHWPVAAGEVRTGLRLSRPAPDHAHADEAFGLLTLVPPRKDARFEPVARDLIVLLDTSGSMHGEPLRQAQAVTSALIETLGARDTLELIEFSSAARRFEKKAVSATERNRRRALKWVASLSAGGATEMKEGILAALESLRGEAQRQVVLVTDGLIGFEQEIVATVARHLPAGSRVHCVGVGSGVNRSLTGPVSRAGRGQELILGLDEDADPAARRLVAATEAPLVVDLRLEGSALRSFAPARIPDLFVGQPALLGLRLKAEGGALRITGRTAEGLFEQTLAVPASAPAEVTGPVTVLVAREEIEDLELELAGGRQASEVDREIEARGLAFQVATRLTSWIAVTKEATVDPRDPTRHERLPQALPHGMSIERLGLRAAAPLPPAAPITGVFAAAAPMAPAGRAAGAKRRSLSLGGLFDRSRGARKEEAKGWMEESAAEGFGGSGAPEEFELDDARSLLDAGRLDSEDELHEVRQLIARLLRRQDRSFTFELELDGELDWAPLLDAELEVELADGSTALIEAAVDPRSTTRDGLHGAGQRLKITLIVEPGAAPEIAEVLVLHLRSAGSALEVRIVDG